MNFVLDKIVKISSFMGVNGPGPSSASNSEGVNGSWLVEVLAWLADAVVKIATVVWGWLISIFYVVVRFCLNIVDILQMFAEKLVGIEAYNQKGGLGAVEKIEDSDLIIRFITNKSILKTFGTICVLGLILLIIFSIIALVRQNYQAAITDGADGAKKGPREVLKLAGRGIFMCLLVPFLVVFGVLGSNAVLASVCNAIKGDNNLTIGGIIFTSSAYEANKFREYANDGVRVPIVETRSTEVIVPANYQDETDMQVLFYKLASGKVYISAISDDAWFTSRLPDYESWVKNLDATDIEIDATKLSGSKDFKLFKSHFVAWYNKYFGGKETLSELGMFNKIINSIYSSNWTLNKNLVNKTYDFGSTYKSSQRVNFGSLKYGEAVNGVRPVSYDKAYLADIIVNSSTYTGHESFAPIELEYYVMADMIDFAVEQGVTLYYVNANHDSIKWSDIVLDPEKPEKIIDVKEYNDKYIVAETSSGVGNKVYVCEAYTDQSLADHGGTLQQYAKDKTGGTMVADSAFIVRYYNGFSRLYWSEIDATSEETGATYIICYKNDAGRYIPVTQETTKFSSSFLAEDYTGPVVARGIFQSEGVIPKDYCLPTAIVEQIVDDYGNELHSIDKTSPFGVTDTYNPASEKDALSKTAGFMGTLADLTGSYLASALEAVFEKSSEAYKKWEEWLRSDLVKELNEDDTVEVASWDDYQAKVNKQMRAYKTEADFNKAKEASGGYITVNIGNLLINPNIAGYSYSYDKGTNSPATHVTFYDSNGRKMSAGGDYVNSEDNRFTLSAGSKFNEKHYLVLQMTTFNDVVIPWYFADGESLSSIMAAITQNNTLASGSKEYTYLVAEYTYDNIQFTIKPKSGPDETYRMLLNFNINQLFEVKRGATDLGTGKTSGEFIVTDEYGLIGGFDIVVEKKANLVISNGEIYYSNGTLFFGRENAKKLYTDYFNNYIIELFSESLLDYFDKGNASVNLLLVLDKICGEEPIPSGALNTLKSAIKNANSTYANDMTSAEALEGTEKINAIKEANTNKIEAIKTAWENFCKASDVQTWLGTNTVLGTANKLTEKMMAKLSAAEYRAGLASMIKEYGESYYTTEEKINPPTSPEADPTKDGTIKFFNPNNQALSEIKYNSNSRVSNNSITLRVAVIGGADKSNNISYATIIDSGATKNMSAESFATDPIHQLIMGGLEENLGIKSKYTDDNMKNRNIAYYDVTYEFSYDEYKLGENNVVATLGLTIDKVSIKVSEVANNYANGLSKPLLRIRNSGIYSDALGKYILTPEGASQYIINNIQAVNDEAVVNGKFGYLDAGSELKTAEKIAGIKETKLGKITARATTVQPRSEYDNFYTYFMRGNLTWTMLFDFCIHLPTIEFSPKLDFDFAFRFRLGTAYNYAEKVVWRLQAGQFYLDYNFRSSVGIGMANIYRMSSINPFILVFSTVLVMSILWTAIWGLIKRIYEVVILFIMLPAVCSTMPMDEGARFGKWQKELIEKIFSAYSVLIMLNLYFVLIPIVKDVTSDLITLGDIPNTITGMFGTISAGIQSFAGWISGLGSKLTGAISSVGGKLGGMMGNIGLSNLILQDADLTNAQQALLGHVNSIIYLMFFLVLTTLLKNGKDIIEGVLDIGKLDEDVQKDVMSNVKAVRESPMVQLPKQAIKGTAKLVGSGIALAAGGLGAAKMFNRFTSGPANPPSSPDSAPPPMSDGPAPSPPSPPPTTPTSQSSGSELTSFDEERTLTEPTVAGNIAEPTVAGEIAAPSGTSPRRSAPPPTFTPASKIERSRFDSHGEVDTEGDESYKRAEEELKDKSDDEIKKSMKGYKKERDDAMDKVLQMTPEAGVLPEDMEGMTYGEYLKKSQTPATDDPERQKLMQAGFAYKEMRNQINEIDKKYKQKVDDAQHYMSVRAQNTDAESKRQETIMREEKEREGMTTEEKTRLDALYQERANFNQMKGMIDDNYQGEDREKAHAEVDGEINRLNGEIDRFMAECKTRIQNESEKAGSSSDKLDNTAENPVSKAEANGKESEKQAENQETSNGEDKKRTTNADLSDEEMIDKVIHGGVIPYVKNKQFKDDHEGFTAEQYKQEEERVRKLREKSNADFDKKDAMYAQLESDKKAASEAATAARNEAQKKVDEFKANNQGKEVPVELEQALEDAKKKQSETANDLSSTIEARRQNSKDKDMANRRFSQYVQTLKIEGEGKGIYNQKGENKPSGTTQQQANNNNKRAEGSASDVSGEKANAQNSMHAETAKQSQNSTTAGKVKEEKKDSGLTIEQLNEQLRMAREDIHASKFASEADRQKTIQQLEDEIVRLASEQGTQAEIERNAEHTKKFNELTENGTINNVEEGNMGLTNAQNNDFERRLLWSSQGIKGEKSVEELKQMSSKELKELFDKKIAASERAIEKAKTDKSISDEEIARKQKNIDKYKEVFDSVVGYHKSSVSYKDIYAYSKPNGKPEQQKPVENVKANTNLGKSGTDVKAEKNAATVVSGVESNDNAKTRPTNEKGKVDKKKKEPTAVVPLDTSQTTAVTQSEEKGPKINIDFSQPIEQKQGSKKKGKLTDKQKQGLKNAGALAAASLVLPPPIVLAAYGGTLLYKKSQKPIKKVKEGLRQNPRAEKFAKNAALFLAAGPVGMGVYAVGKKVNEHIKKRKDREQDSKIAKVSASDGEQEERINELEDKIDELEKKVDSMKNSAKQKEEQKSEKSSKPEAKKNASKSTTKLSDEEIKKQGWSGDKRSKVLPKQEKTTKQIAQPEPKKKETPSLPKPNEEKTTKSEESRFEKIIDKKLKEIKKQNEGKNVVSEATTKTNNSAKNEVPKSAPQKTEKKPEVKSQNKDNANKK